jgi:hypothetical protein
MRMVGMVNSLRENYRTVVEESLFMRSKPNLMGEEVEEDVGAEAEGVFADVALAFRPAITFQGTTDIVGGEKDGPTALVFDSFQNRWPDLNPRLPTARRITCTNFPPELPQVVASQVCPEKNFVGGDRDQRCPGEDLRDLLSERFRKGGAGANGVGKERSTSVDVFS